MSAPHLVAREPGGGQAGGERLVDSYRALAHRFRPRPIDHALRGMDVVLGAGLLAAAAPVLVLAAVAILLSSGRPVLYRGARVGRFGEVFAMYKLRTLRADAERRLGPYFGEELDRRTEAELTAVGRLLRATKADELPQLWNVVRGDMSLVGPRPVRPAFFEQLCEAIPAYWQRLVVRPGMTGPAQLRLHRAMTWEEKLAHDFEYIADRSPRLYLAVLRDTAAMLARRASRS